MVYPSDRRLRGSAIRLGPLGAALGIAEGIETALAVQQLSGKPCWAVGSASLLAGFEPPAEVDALVIWADRDRSRAGEQAAWRLAQRLRDQGVPVEVRLPGGQLAPQQSSLDWLDVLQAQWAQVA